MTVKKKIKKLSKGEQMVWAAAFASAVQAALKNPPTHVAGSSGDGWREWEASQVANAVEMATTIVEHMQDAPKKVKAGWGAASECFAMLNQMLKS